MRKYLKTWFDAMSLAMRTRKEAGDISIAGLMTMGIAMIFIAIGFTVYPIIMTGTDAILAYAYSGNASITDATFTGLTTVTGIVPLIVLMGFISAGVITGFLGGKMMKAGTGGSMSPGGLMMLSMGLIFIAVGTIIYPVTLDGIASVLDGTSHHGISSSYTGLSAVLLATPLIILTAFIGGGIVAGFFGIKSMASKV